MKHTCKITNQIQKREKAKLEIEKSIQTLKTKAEELGI